MITGSEAGPARSRAAQDAWLPCTRNVFQMVKIQALCLKLMLVAASSQFRRISCSPLEVLTFIIYGPRFRPAALFLPVTDARVLIAWTASDHVA
ncbi:hypothetical protein FVA81_01320 (plasmid) [Rhizobium sp. WL3]|nr:hypothetical protein FVA81_01320 [Rhizobium sp. WL3]